MKKFFTYTFIAMFIACSIIRPAEAGIKIDVTHVVTKINGYVQKINESVQKVTQQINHVKKMASQGFNLDKIRDLAKSYASSYVKMLINEQMKGIVASAAKKEAQEKEEDLASYETALTQKYEKQGELISENQSKVKDAQQENKNEIKSKEQEVSERKQELDDVMDSEDDKAYQTALTNYEKSVSELNKLKEDSVAYKNMLKKLDDEEKALNELKNSLEDDETLKAKREIAKQAAEKVNEIEKEFIGAEFGDDDEWDTVTTLDKAGEYGKFVNRYFYDPAATASTPIAHQSNVDRINQDRRYLYVNTAVHLMQVSTTARYNKIKRQKAVEAMAKNKPNNKSEAMEAYAATKLENAKALLIYARVLSAKLQYMSAKKLLVSDLQRIGKNDDPYNLDKYYLTGDEVRKLYEALNTVKEAPKVE